MARRRQWMTGDVCVEDGCSKILRHAQDTLEGSTVGEGVEGRCSVHHRKRLRDGTIKPFKLKIDWSVEHRCGDCDAVLCKRTVPKADRGDRKPLGTVRDDDSFQCQNCMMLEQARARGVQPMNRAEVSADGLSQKCNSCGEWKIYSDNSFRMSGGRYRTICRSCDNLATLKYKELHRDEAREKRIQNKFNIDYNDLLEIQGHMCALCEITRGEEHEKYLYVDHDHSCCPGQGSCGMCVRGLLCGNCNLILGMMKDDLSRIEKQFGGSVWGTRAMRYLVSWPATFLAPIR